MLAWGRKTAVNVYGEQHPPTPVPPSVDFGILVDSLSPRSISSCMRSSVPLSTLPTCINQPTTKPIAHTVSPIIVKFPLHHIRPQHLRHLLGVFDVSLGLFACGGQVPADFKPTAGFGERCVEDVRIASRRLATTRVWAAAEGTLKSGPGGAEKVAVGCERHYVDRGRFFLTLLGREVEFCRGSVGN